MMRGCTGVIIQEPLHVLVNPAPPASASGTVPVAAAAAVAPPVLPATASTAAMPLPAVASASTAAMATMAPVPVPAAPRLVSIVGMRLLRRACAVRWLRRAVAIGVGTLARGCATDGMPRVLVHQRLDCLRAVQDLVQHANSLHAPHKHRMTHPTHQPPSIVMPQRNSRRRPNGTSPLEHWHTHGVKSGLRSYQSFLCGTSTLVATVRGGVPTDGRAHRRRTPAARFRVAVVGHALRSMRRGWRRRCSCVRDSGWRAAFA